MIHVCSHKKMFNLLVTKEEGTAKMMDGSVCEVNTEIINVTCRDEIICAMEAVRYVSKAW